MKICEKYQCNIGDICDAIATVASDIGAAVTAGAQASSGGAGGGIGAVSSIGNAVANTGKTGMSIAADFALFTSEENISAAIKVSSGLILLPPCFIPYSIGS